MSTINGDVDETFHSFLAFSLAERGMVHELAGLLFAAPPPNTIDRYVSLI